MKQGKKIWQEACEGSVCSIENDSAYKCFAGLRRHDRLAVYDSGFATKVDEPNLIYDLTKTMRRIMRNIFTIGRIIIGQVLGLIMHIVHGHFKPDRKAKDLSVQARICI